MKIVNRLGPCVGVTLANLMGWRVELWMIPPCHEVPKHTHSLIDNWIVYLWGRALVTKTDRSVWLCPSERFRKFHIRPNESHGIRTKTRLWLLTFQKWLGPKDLSESVAENITFTHN